MKPVVVLGDLVVDYTLAVKRLPIHAGEHQRLDALYRSPGGAANTLIMGRRLGLPMQAAGTIGQDEAGRWLRQALADQQINVDAVVLSADLKTTEVYCLVAPDGQHVFLGYQGGGVSERISEVFLQVILTASALFCNGWNYHGGYRQATLQAAFQASKHGIPVFFDVGPEYRHFDPSWVQELLTHTHTLLATEDELLGLMMSHTIEAAAHEAIQRGVQRVIVKRGAQGAALITANVAVDHPGYTVTVRDMTGAGDALAAAVIYAHLNNMPPQDMLKLANAAGAAAVTFLGSGYNMPTRDDVVGVLKMSGDERLLDS